MYKLLCLLLLVGISEALSRFGRTCNLQRSRLDAPWVRRSGSRYRARLESVVTTIARDLIGAQRKIERFCNMHADHYMREIYSVEHYKLILDVEDFDEDSISVKVINRLIFVMAEDCSSTYSDIRLLPDIVDVELGKWTYSMGELTIFFPYIATSDDPVSVGCGGPIDTSVITIPKCDDEPEFDKDIDIRFGDTTFRDSMKDYVTIKVKRT